MLKNSTFVKEVVMKIINFSMLRASEIQVYASPPLGRMLLFLHKEIDRQPDEHDGKDFLKHVR